MTGPGPLRTLSRLLEMLAGVLARVSDELPQGAPAPLVWRAVAYVVLRDLAEAVRPPGRTFEHPPA